MLFETIQKLAATFDFNTISSDRKVILQPLIDFIQISKHEKNDIRLNFICTHNSRRSHLSQIWAQAAATHYKVKNVYCYSGGTEATALFPKVAETLQNSGFEIELLSEGINPVYAIKYSANDCPIIGFSKTFDNNFNPQSQFAAILTCSSADQGCPFIVGASKRIPITFEDPKAFDNTPLQSEKYHERSLQIATEMFYVFSTIV
ncbi:low molecular weight phosphatase family protein [Flavobacterium algicola]|uniref:protein-tyrosine-phosphatase n=1 Tax=Flavobacterium algicola TaxID=556529 RepID=UPI001EFDACC6|nr:protein-tyrosine-phosphatase [Flavobacterium algicola]MCG9792225.1 protein-tyrosine-phosphatase [Flavobacterium algicola]